MHSSMHFISKQLLDLATLLNQASGMLLAEQNGKLMWHVCVYITISLLFKCITVSREMKFVPSRVSLEKLF